MAIYRISHIRTVMQELLPQKPGCSYSMVRQSSLGMRVEPATDPTTGQIALGVFPDDVLFEIFVTAIVKYGHRRTLSLLLVRKSLTLMLLRVFYSRVVILSATSLRRLNRTLTIYPSRVRLVQTLFIRLGTHRPIIPLVSYPYIPLEDYMAHVPASESIVRNDHASVCTLLSRVAGYLTTLVLNTAYCFPEIVHFMCRQSFPRVTEAQLPGPLMFHSSYNRSDNPNLDLIPKSPPSIRQKPVQDRWPKLQRVQLLYSNDTGVASGFYGIDFSPFPSIDQASISFYGFYDTDVRLTVSLMQMGSRLRTLVVEDDCGARVPVADVDNVLVDQRLFFIWSDVFASMYPWAYRPRSAFDYWQDVLRLAKARENDGSIVIT